MYMYELILDISVIKSSTLFILHFLVSLIIYLELWVTHIKYICFINTGFN